MVPICLVPISNLAMAYSHKYTYLKNYDSQPFSLKEKQVLELKNLSLSETDLNSNSDGASKKIMTTNGCPALLYFSSQE